MDEKETQFKYARHEEDTDNFLYDMSSRKLSVLYEIAHQLKRIADNLDKNNGK